MNYRSYYLNHAPIPFLFKQSARDFVVDEIPFYDFSGEGEHLILKIRKKNLTTWGLIDSLATFLGIPKKEIGYAGLKDKNAMTVQYISVHKRHEEKLKSYDREGVKIIETTYHNNKIKMGHLKGNRFFIRVKRVGSVEAQKIDQALKMIATNGMPNYFGYQRFGTDGENYKIGQAIAEGKRKERDKSKRRLFINAYQSYLFNYWLASRIDLNKHLEAMGVQEASDLLKFEPSVIKALQKQKHPFKTLPGDVMMHYPYGRAFITEDIATDAQRFFDRDSVVTGLLSGKRAIRATDHALEFEKPYDVATPVDGERRYAWVFPEDIEGEYKEEERWFEFRFTLPKGSYATVLIEEIAKMPIKSEEGE
jgi:tRNA pseudouridine13 synthase